MPVVTVKWVEGHNQERRDIIAKRITDAIHEVTKIPETGIWVVFEDVKASDWFIESTSVAVQRAGKSKT